MNKAVRLDRSSRIVIDLHRDAALKLDKLCQHRQDTFHLKKFKRQIIGDAIDLLYEHELKDDDAC